MHVIVLASRKGGAGKTTLTSHLAVEAEARGAGPVAVIDLDPMGGLSAWWNAREAKTPLFPEIKTTLGKALGDLTDRGVQTVIIDTPPAATDAIGAVIELADLVVMPVVPSANDLWAISETINLVVARDRPLMFALNNAGVGTQLERQAHQTLQLLAAARPGQHHVAPVEAIWHTRQDYRACMTDGRTVTETAPASRSAAEVAALWGAVHRAVGGRA
jgi:chromosome partitioning protein